MYPGYLSKLVPIDKMFSKKQENFQNNLSISPVFYAPSDTEKKTLTELYGLLVLGFFQRNKNNIQLNL